MQSEGIHMELKVLHQHGWSISQLAREFGLNWRTVKREVTSETPRHYPERAKPTMLTASQRAHIERRLAVCSTIRGTLLHHEVCRDYGYTGSYPSFARHLEVLRPQQAHEPEIRFETAPGVQVQADWAHFGLFPLGDDLVELYGLVAILGYSRAPAIHFATDRTRQTTFSCLLHCLNDLGGVPSEILTDRDPAFCIGAMSDGRAILAPEWVDLCGVIGTIPRACRPYRAKTKGKVERMVRETKESMLPWLSGQFVPSEPTLADYDQLGRTWIEEIVLPRRHRTTKCIVGDAWSQERPLLTPVPNRLLHPTVDLQTPPYPSSVIDLTAHRLGEHVQVRDLAEYEVAL
jgi:transposase